MTETLAQPSPLQAMLHARSVAIVGISQPGRFGGQIYQNLVDYGYQGSIYGVNPRYQRLYDQPCYPSLRDLPEKVDCAVLAVPNAGLVDVLSETAQVGIPSAVIFASAYSEPVDGQPSLQEQLASIAKAHNMALCGPNSMGFYSFGQRLVVSGYTICPDMPTGGITFISHSGSVFDALPQNDRDIHFNYVISSGNEAVTTAADYMLFALEDPTTRVIACFLEAVRDPEGFVAALRQAAERDIPVVVLKVGLSEAGQCLAQAHSGAFTGSDAACDALFEYYGVRRVRSLDEMLDTLELLTRSARPPTPHLAAICDSGGERTMIADMAEAEGISFAEINAETQARLAAVLEPGLAPINPVDIWGTGRDFDHIYRECLAALSDDPETGFLLVIVEMTRASNLMPTGVDIALEALPHLRKPLAFMVSLPAAASEEQLTRLRQHDVPVLMGSESGLRAVRHLLEYAAYRRRRDSSPPAGEAAPPRPAPAVIEKLRAQLQATAGQPLSEHDSKQILAAYGLPVTDERQVHTREAALSAAEAIGYPVALKTASGELHKTDSGGVQLNLADSVSLASAYDEMSARLGPAALVQAMVPAGVEMLLGMSTDLQFGPLLTLGLGGIFVETYRDVRVLMPPVSRSRVVAALESLQGVALLHGARGRKPVDLDALIEAVQRFSTLVTDLGDLITEIDINPLMALPEGVRVVDALIVPRNPVVPG